MDRPQSYVYCVQFVVAAVPVNTTAFVVAAADNIDLFPPNAMAHGTSLDAAAADRHSPPTNYSPFW